jgi:hypothetical protein
VFREVARHTSETVSCGQMKRTQHLYINVKRVMASYSRSNILHSEELFNLDVGTLIVKVICDKSFCSDFLPLLLHLHLKAINLICIRLILVWLNHSSICLLRTK